MSLPKYIKEMLRQIATGEMDYHRGQVNHIPIYHDDWCEIFNGGECNCNPDVGTPRRSWPENG